MKFEVSIQHSGQAGSDTVEIEGDLSAVKTYLKLVVKDNFNWAAVLPLGKLKMGDVDRWMVRQNRTTGELNMSVFSFFNVEPMININTMRQAYDPEQTSSGAVNKLLGGGKF